MKYLYLILLQLSASAQSFQTFDVNLRRLAVKTMSMQTADGSTVEKIAEKALMAQENEILSSYAKDNFEASQIKNHRGFSYATAVPDFDIKLKRSVAPDLFSSGWVVNDEIAIEVSAKAFLGKLAQENIITNLSQATLDMFGKINYRQTYLRSKIVKSYSEGMSVPPSFTFSKRLDHNFDSLFSSRSISIDGELSGNLAYGVLGANLKGKLKYALQKSTSARLEDGMVRVDIENKKSVEAGLEAALVLDFAKLLKITLLKYEYSLEVQSSKSYTYLLSSQQYNALSSLNSLPEQYQTHMQDRSSRQMNSDFSFALFGKSQYQRSETASLKSKDSQYQYISLAEGSVHYIESIGSKIWKKLFGKLGVPTQARYKAAVTRDLAMEFDTDKDQSSFNYTFNFMTQKMRHSKSKARINRYLGWWVSDSTEIKKLIKENKLQNEFSVKTRISSDKNLFETIMNNEDIHQDIKYLCRLKKRKSRCIKSVTRKLNSFQASPKSQALSQLVGVLVSTATDYRGIRAVLNIPQMQVYTTINSFTIGGLSYTTHIKHNNIGHQSLMEKTIVQSLN